MERFISKLRLPRIFSEKKNPDTKPTGMTRIHKDILEGLDSYEQEGLLYVGATKLAQIIKSTHPEHRFWDHLGPDTIRHAMYDLENSGQVRILTIRIKQPNGRYKGQHLYANIKSKD